LYKNVLFCIKFLKNFLGRGISRPHLCLSPIPYFWIRHCYKVHLECLLGRILYSLGDELVVTGHPEGKVRYMVITVTVERTTLPRSSVSAIRVRNESRAICIVYKPTFRLQPIMLMEHLFALIFYQPGECSRCCLDQVWQLMCCSLCLFVHNEMMHASTNCFWRLSPRGLTEKTAFVVIDGGSCWVTSFARFAAGTVMMINERPSPWPCGIMPCRWNVKAMGRSSISSSKYRWKYTVGHKKRGTLLLSISSPIIDQFSKFFHWRTLRTICNNVIIIYLTTLQLRCYTTV